MVATVALTGATGFIGRALLEHFIDRGWRVRGLYRSAAKLRSIPTHGAEWVQGDLTNESCLCQLLHDVHAVVHCAGTVRGSSPEDFRHANVVGVAALVRAIAEVQPPPPVLALSSLAARAPELSDYAASKREGEAVFAAAAKNVSWTIFRPPAVYGPGDREILPLLRMLERGVIPVIARRESRFSLLYIDDLARAAERWLLTHPHGGGVYALHDGRPGGYDWNEIIAIGEQQLQRRVHRLPVPTTLVKLIAAGNTLLARRLNYAPMLTSGKVRELAHPDWVCDNSAISRVLDWQPRIQLQDGLRRTLGR